MSKKFGFVCALVGAMGLLGSNVAYSAPAIEKTSIAAILKAKKEAAAAEAAEAAKAETKAATKKRHTARKAAPAKKKVVKTTTRKKTAKTVSRKNTVKKVSRNQVSKKAVTAKVTTSHQDGRPYASIINRYAATYGVPVPLAHAVVRHESGYRANARGAAGEIGLMQLKLSTARGLGYTGSAKGLYDPATNIQYGMKYLAMARKLGGGTTCGTILKYNAGHGATRMNPISAAYCSQVKVYMRSF